MYKSIVPLVLIFIFAGCLGLEPKSEIKPNQKAFEEEDAYILLALRSEQIGDYKSAAKIFEMTYEKSDKKEYLYRSLQNELSAKDNEKVVLRIDEILKGTLSDLSLVRMKIIALIQLQKLEEAKNLALKLVSLTRKVDDYLLVSGIYVEQKKFDTAVKYLESAYAQEYNEKIMDKISIILYVNLQRKKDAIAQLETHSRMHGCSKLICSRLLGFYSDENNIDGLLSTSLRLYEIDPNDETTKRIIQIYAYQKNYVKLIAFLQKSGGDDELLLQLYINAQNYAKAAPLAQKLYFERGDVTFLAQSAVYEYESSADKNDTSMQNRVIKKLKKAVQIKETPLFLNYLGYLLIDHEIDVEAGMEYVKKALKREPTSLFYLDSLAWGYYKLGECKRAKEIMDKVVYLEGGDDEEVVFHVKIINKCLEIKNKESISIK